jgi:hypothetical protein
MTRVPVPTMSGTMTASFATTLSPQVGMRCFHRVMALTVASASNRPAASIEWRFANTDATITNNLVSHNLRERDGAGASLAGNLEEVPLSLFADGTGGDLHLVGSASSAIDRGVAISAGLCDDDIDGDLRSPARDIGADEYSPPPPATVTYLCVRTAITGTGVLTATLRWTAPADAVTTTLRYSGTLITGMDWAAASLMADALSGSTETYTAEVPHGDDTVYFALKSRNAEGAWSALSNNAFWPHWDVLLPLVTKGK